jgi:nucleoside-diphosphate-sugar epimerase
MHIFIAGGTGTIGVPLVRALIARGHQVTALTKTARKIDEIRVLGASPVVADALDPDALTRVVLDARPTHVIHQLTALPKDGPRRASDLAPTNRLRDEGTRNLLAASIQAGARRIVGGSFALFQAPIPADAPPDVVEAARALHSMEAQILDASHAGRIEGLVLRYGLFYGSGNPMTSRMIQLLRRRMLPVVRHDRGQLPFIHLEDAVSATILALDRGPAGSAYDIVDDEPASMSEVVAGLAQRTGAPRPFAVPLWLPKLVAPYMAGFMSIRLPLSNARARAELGWRPMYPTWRDGLAALDERAA